MLKTIATYILIVLGIAILALSTSSKTTAWLSDKMEEAEAWWGKKTGREDGDLVGMASLNRVSKFCSKRDYKFEDLSDSTNNNVDLYLNGDSYTFKVPGSAYNGINQYKYAWLYTKHIPYNLDTTKKSILILEHTERVVRTFYSGLDLLKLVYNEHEGSQYGKYAPPQKSIITNSDDLTFIDHGLYQFKWYTNQLFNERINQNIEQNLLSSHVVVPIKEFKGAMNYYLFNRASGNVVVSKKEDQLYIKETVGYKSKTSSFSPITNAEYDSLVSNLNLLYKHYKEEGFDEVYLNIIPNPITVLEPEGYNNLIPKLQNDPNLNIKIIDTYSLFKKAKTRIYRPGDTHWNNNGLQIWLQQINDTLAKWNY